MTQNSIRLNKWFSLHGRRPAFVAITLVLALWGVQLLRTMNDHEKVRAQELKSVSETVSLGLMQKNRILLESLLTTSQYQFGSESSLLCKEGRHYLSSGLPVACDSKAGFWTEIVSVRIPGFSDFDLKLFVGRWGSIESLLPVFSLSILLMISFLFLLFGIQRRFTSDILNPLQDGLGKDQAFPIIELENIRQSLQEITESQVKVAVADAVLQRNQQIAHDIKSPLAALGALGSSADTLPEQERLMMRASINRIKDIANNLSRRPSLDGDGASKKISSQLLSTLIDPLLSEKRTQYRFQLGTAIEAAMEEGSNLCAKVDPTEFKRIISNLVNNGVEALERGGRVQITLREMGPRHVEIDVTDNGKGIPEEILPTLMQRGVTFGKSGGSGLGLFHAKTTVESWGGELRVESSAGVGTSVKLLFPRSESPPWLVTGIKLEGRAQVVVLDDDESIHFVWRDRFEKARPSAGERLRHLSTPTQLREESQESSDLFLIDYELLGFGENGLDLIAELGIAERSCLVTSRFEDEAVLRRCQSIGVKVLPKTLAAYVPIEIQESESPGPSIFLTTKIREMTARSS